MVAMAAANSSPGEPLRQAARGMLARCGIVRESRSDAAGDLVDGNDGRLEAGFFLLAREEPGHRSRSG